MLDTFTLVGLPPAVGVMGEIVPTATGARLGAAVTKTAMVCVAVNPLVSRAVTVTVVVPSAFGVIATVLLDTLTVALEVSDDTAE